MFKPCPNTSSTIAARKRTACPRIGPARVFTVSEIAAPARPTAQRRMYETISENTFTTPRSTEIIFLQLSRIDFPILPS